MTCLGKESPAWPWAAVTKEIVGRSQPLAGGKLWPHGAGRKEASYGPQRPSQKSNDITSTVGFFLSQPKNVQPQPNSAFAFTRVSQTPLVNVSTLKSNSWFYSDDDYVRFNFCAIPIAQHGWHSRIQPHSLLGGGDNLHCGATKWSHDVGALVVPQMPVPVKLTESP